MRVAVSAAQRFHAFELARQLQRRSHLQRMYTGYPLSKVYEVDHELVRSHWIGTTAYLLLARNGLDRVARPLNALAATEYDHWVARHLEPCDVVVSLSSFGLDTFRAARRRGILSVCDRGSTHIQVQRDLLLEEYRRFGVEGNPMDDRIMARELAEYEEADIITVPSSFARRSFLQMGFPEERVIRIPYGVDLGLFHPSPRRDDVFRVLFVGMASLQKGIQYLLEAVQPLQLPKFEVMLVGGVAKDAGAILAKYADCFTYRGFVPRTQLADVYSQGSVLVLPSVQEGLALVQAQAMACGLPVIATTNTGAEDLFTDGVEGMIVPARDAQTLREAIVRLYEEPKLRDVMGVRAAARVQAIGGWDTYGDAVVTAYDNALIHRRSVEAEGSAA